MSPCTFWLAPHGVKTSRLRMGFTYTWMSIFLHPSIHPWCVHLFITQQLSDSLNWPLVHYPQRRFPRPLSARPLSARPLSMPRLFQEHGEVPCHPGPYSLRCWRVWLNRQMPRKEAPHLSIKTCIWWDPKRCMWWAQSRGTLTRSNMLVCAYSVCLPRNPCHDQVPDNTDLRMSPSRVPHAHRKWAVGWQISALHVPLQHATPTSNQVCLKLACCRRGLLKSNNTNAPKDLPCHQGTEAVDIARCDGDK